MERASKRASMQNATRMNLLNYKGFTFIYPSDSDSEGHWFESSRAYSKNAETSMILGILSFHFAMSLTPLMPFILFIRASE